MKSVKSIYTTYKERLVEISGKSRSIFSRNGNTKYSYDLKGVFNNELFEEFISNLWKGNNKPFEIIGKETLKDLYNASGIDEKLKVDPKYLQLLKEDPQAAKKWLQNSRTKSGKKLVESTVNTFSKLKKEIVDIARETGRYELYVGYPFVHGSVGTDVTIKAPLILFPIKINIIDDMHVEVEPIKDMPVTLNKALIMAYAREKKINIDELNMEFNNFNKQFKSIEEVLDYLREYHIDFNDISGNKLTSFDSSGIPSKDSNISVKNHCIIGRYSLANSIYLDYNELEKKKASTNEAIDELIYAKKTKKKKANKSNELYTINKLDCTQEEAVRKINDDGNMVIYGPPGTGKSQTIVNIISDALARKKRVLIVSQKKAALDVVYNRLGKVRDKAMFLVDPEHEKESFYKKCLSAHKNISEYDSSIDLQKHAELEEKIQNNYKELEKIFSVLYKPCDFGVSLETMYEQSSQISRNSYDYQIYEKMIDRKDLLSIKYDRLNESLENINKNKRKDLYYKYRNMKNKNPIIEHLRSDLDVYKVDNAINDLERLISIKGNGFDSSKYPYCEYLIAHYSHNMDKMRIDIDGLVDFIARQREKKGFMLKSGFEKELKASFEEAFVEIERYLEDFYFLEDILTERGYQLMVAAVLNGNTAMFKNLKQGLKNYTNLRDIKLELANLDDTEKKILDFAYETGDTQVKYNQIIDNFMPIRMYREIVKEEQDKKEDLAKIMSFDSIKEEILELKKKQNELSGNIASGSFNNDYISNFSTNKNSSDFLYQINKQQNPWPIRKFMSEYKDLMLDLYPCWLLSPENASTIMPLVKDMFDVVLFDEASQVFIENTLPIMYRGKNVVVAGDNKQLRPTSTFMKRYVGSDIDEEMDPTTEATLEVESLLDLATARLSSTNLNYHYRSKNEELIDFSNNYFYDGNLEIVPNLVGSKKNRAIARVKVDGKWIDRRNETEAKAVVQLLKQALATRKNKESIGIISFNSDQAMAIEDEIRNECKKDSAFAEAILKEQNRFENNEDISLFVKNLENVQGDERDIIILSVGYAPNENGRVNTNFGSLSMEGGENRLNVAITRAKSKTMVVTSIEPEELKVENAKNEGPKILKKYLTYVRAVANNKKEETRICLNNKKEDLDVKLHDKDSVAIEIKEALEKLGYRVDVKLGNTKRKIDLAIYDEKLDRYLLGIECVNRDYKNIDEMVENQIYHVDFLKSRGWKLHHVWTRDWWLNKTKVINCIVKEIEQVKKEQDDSKEKVIVKKSKK